MKGYPNFLPCFWVNQDVLRLVEMGQKVVIIQFFHPAWIPVHLSFTGISKVALYQYAEH